MALNRNPAIERPDHTKATAGSEGEVTKQEPATGKSVNRRGGTEEQADVDMGNAANPIDLIAEGDFESGPRNIGGAGTVSGFFTSDDDNTFSVKIDLLDSDEALIATKAPQPLQDTTEIDFDVVVDSDRIEIRVTDTSGLAQNNVRGTANSH